MCQVQKSWKRATVDKFGMYTPESNGIEAEDKLQRSINPYGGSSDAYVWEWIEINLYSYSVGMRSKFDRVKSL